MGTSASNRTRGIYPGSAWCKHTCAACFAGEAAPWHEAPPWCNASAERSTTSAAIGNSAESSTGTNCEAYCDASADAGESTGANTGGSPKGDHSCSSTTEGSSSGSNTSEACCCRCCREEGNKGTGEEVGKENSEKENEEEAAPCQAVQPACEKGEFSAGRRNEKAEERQETLP